MIFGGNKFSGRFAKGSVTIRMMRKKCKKELMNRSVRNVSQATSHVEENSDGASEVITQLLEIAH